MTRSDRTGGLARFLWTGGFALAVGPALALTPSEVFEKTAPSVWAVRTLDAQGRALSFGSAVVIAPGKLVTSCHVLAKAKSIQLRQESVEHAASLEQADAERDLCLLSAASIAAPAVAIAPPVKIGQRVYAITSPARLALTLSEGLVSGTRSEDPALPPLQSTVALSQGSSGGGLFDEQARLVGIMTLNAARAGIAQNVNFALPAAWIAEIPARAAEQLARRERQLAAQAAAKAVSAAPSGASAPPEQGMPLAGTTWKYSFRDQYYRKRVQHFSVQVAGYEGSAVRESFSVEDVPSSSDAESAVSVKELAFRARRLAREYSLLELAPYLVVGRGADAPVKPGDAVPNYPSSSGSRADWKSKVTVVTDEQTVVPAGTFSAVRIEVTGDSDALFSRNAFVAPKRYRYTAWYAPNVGRYVMLRHEVWSGSGQKLGDDIVKLVEYRPAPAASSR